MGSAMNKYLELEAGMSGLAYQPRAEQRGPETYASLRHMSDVSASDAHMDHNPEFVAAGAMSDLFTTFMGAFHSEAPRPTGARRPSFGAFCPA